MPALTSYSAVPRLVADRIQDVSADLLFGREVEVRSVGEERVELDGRAPGARAGRSRDVELEPERRRGVQTVESDAGGIGRRQRRDRDLRLLDGRRGLGAGDRDVHAREPAVGHGDQQFAPHPLDRLRRKAAGAGRRARRSSRRRGAARTRWPCRVWPTTPPGRRRPAACSSGVIGRAQIQEQVERYVPTRPLVSGGSGANRYSASLASPGGTCHVLQSMALTCACARASASVNSVDVAMTTLQRLIVSVAVEPGRAGNPASAGVVR